MGWLGHKKFQRSEEPLTRCNQMSNAVNKISSILTLGGRVTCLQCQAVSKRSGLQCRGPAVKGKRVCRMHGGKSTGPRTPEGRQRCAASKTVHGNETTEKRLERSLNSARLAVLEWAGHAMGFMEGTRTRGPKPKQICNVEIELQNYVKLIFIR